MKKLMHIKYDWKLNNNITKLMHAISANGKEARFIGGYVRDILLKKPVNDIDIATEATPDEIINLLKAANIKAIPTGIKHGTITAVIDKETFEITTLRRDKENFGRHATVEFINDWQQDAARRDFTINAMSLDMDGNIHDYFNGIDDANAGIIRFVGDPEKRISEDYLRILRYFRMLAYYSKDIIHQPSLNGCIKLAANIKILSRERVGQEILRLFNAPDPLATIKIMAKHKAFQSIFPDVVINICPQDIKRLSHYFKLEKKHNATISALCRMAVLFKSYLLNKQQITVISSSLILSKTGKDKFIKYCCNNIDLNKPIDNLENYYLINHLGHDIFKQILLISAAFEQIDIASEYWEFIDHNKNRKFQITGNDVILLGITDGLIIGKYLKLTKIWWIENAFNKSRQQCLEYLETIDKNNIYDSDLSI